MLNQISPMDTFSAAPSNPQATDLDKHLTKVQKVKRKAKKLKKKEKKWKHKLKKCQKEVRRLSLANVHLDQQLDFSRAIWRRSACATKRRHSAIVIGLSRWRCRNV